MNIEERIINAGKKLQAYDKVKYAHFLNLMEGVHNNAWDVIEGKKSHLAAAEFAHAFSIISEKSSARGKLERDKIELPTKVLDDGSLFGCGKWELLDPGWDEAILAWLEHVECQAPFDSNPANIKIPNNVKINIAGDWGTGYWRKSPPSPAENVANAMLANNADISIHLGDVYYAGSRDQEINNLLNIWPAGKLGAFTLNSNHEMYDGAFAYFDALKQKFNQQKQCSYFSLENDDWLVVGLDSAYYADKWELYMDGKIAEQQQDWLKGLPAKKGIILLSHHNAYDLKGEQQQALYNEVMQQLIGENKQLRYEQVFWYWGHLHNVATYKPMSFCDKPVYTRCVGHGAIPYGNATDLENAAKVAWYETALANDPDIPVRVLNGFAELTLTDNGLEERLIDENGLVVWPASAINLA
ncbi:MAG: metallophosphoesterase [Methyloprofundus sp.]|nr:metallophosphoesterase [Methyloprofundus sp.]